MLSGIPGIDLPIEFNVVRWLCIDGGMKTLCLVFLIGLLTPGTIAIPQQPSSPTPPASPTGQQPVSSSAGTSSTKKPVPSFLIVGTIFNEKGLSFGGVHVRVRQAGEKKFRWDAYTNSRGEFAIRVFPGYEYEVVIHEKYYADQTKRVDGKVDVQQRLSVQLELLNQTKSGAKP